MERLEDPVSIFATLVPSNKAAKSSFTQVAQKMLEDEDWNQTARQNIEVDDDPLQMSTYASVSESDGGTGPPKTFRPVFSGHYAFDFAKPPRHPAKGWLIGGGKFSTSDERPEILLTERKKHDGVSSRHARLVHNFASGALVITALDRNTVRINGKKLVDNQLVIHGQRTSLEFGNLAYSLDVHSANTPSLITITLQPFWLRLQNLICTLIDVIDPAAGDRTRGYETFGLDQVFQVYKPLCNWTIQKLIDDGTELDIEIRGNIFWQLLEGIEYLHLIGIMHRDIKPLNMTVVSINPDDPQARLIDFGLAIQGTESYEYRVGTESYLAPEMLAGWEKRTTHAYTSKTDMFAFGLSMYQFFCQQRCYWARIDTDARGNLTDATFWQIQNRLHESQIPAGFKELISAFISWDPLNRHSAKEAMEIRAEIQSVNKQCQPGTFSEGKYDAGTGDECDAIEKSLGNMGNFRLDPTSQHQSCPAGRPWSWNTDPAFKSCI